MNQNLPGQTMNPLISSRDIDSGRWKPLWYYVAIDVEIAAGSINIGSIPMNSQPYVLTAISTKIVGDTADPSTTGLYQDGQYDIEFRDEINNYQSPGFIPADLMYGSLPQGFIRQLTLPIAYGGNHTLTFRVQNRVPRVLVPAADFFQVGICLHGIADWQAQR